MIIPKFTNEELQILDEIDKMVGYCKEALANNEQQKKDILAEIKRIINIGYWSVNDRVRGMEEQMSKLKDLEERAQIAFAEEYVLEELRTKISSMACKRVEEEG